MKKNNPVVYEPNNGLRAGLFSLFKQMVAELRDSGELGYRLFLRDFSAKYRQSLFGVLWVVLIPLFAVGIFVAMNRAGVLKAGDTGVPYPVFALFGITVWSLFTGLTGSIAGVVGASGGLVTKINFPRIALLHSPVLIAFVDFGVRLGLLALVMAWGRVTPSAGSLFFPLALLPLVFFSIGIGMVLSIVGALFKDLGDFVNLVLTIVMLVTPVVYAMPSGGLLMRLTVYNPLYYMVDVPRALLFSGTVNHPGGFIISSIGALLVFLMSWRFYHLAMGRIVEKA